MNGYKLVRKDVKNGKLYSFLSNEIGGKMSVEYVQGKFVNRKSDKDEGLFVK